MIKQTRIPTFTKKLTCCLAGLLCTATCLAQNQAPLAGETAHAAPDASVMSLGSNGSILIHMRGREFCRLKPLAANKEWHFSEGTRAGRAQEDRMQFSLVASGPILGEAWLAPKDDCADAVWHFSAPEPVEFNTLGVGMNFPIDLMAGGFWKADEKEGTFPDDFTQASIYGGNASSLVLRAPDGHSIRFSFPLPVHLVVQDDRQWGGQHYTVRIGQASGSLKPDNPYELHVSIATEGKVAYQIDSETVIQPGKDWIPLRAFLDIVPGSALDLSVIQSTHGECGSRGRVITTPAGHFAYADSPDQPRRFYGPNLCFSSQFMSKGNVDTLLDRWLRMGYNTLRIHHYEFGFTTPVWKTGFDWDPAKLDQFCYLISGCAKRGIWLTTDLYVSRPAAPEQIGVLSAKPYVNDQGNVDMQTYKALVLVHEPAFEDFARFTRQLLNHVNPYSGKRLAEEPALAWISLINEGAPGNRVRSLPEWKLAWNKWLDARYPDRAALAEALSDLKDTESPQAGNVEFPANVMDDSPRGRVCQVFMADTERRFVERARVLLRDELKCPALLTNHNNGPNSTPDQVARTSFDYVDDHFYVDHPIFEKSWRLPSRSANHNPVHDGGIRPISSAPLRLWGKPMTISEYNFSAPGRYRGVGALMTGALAALQDWDALWRFAYAHGDKEIFTPSPIDYFNIVRDPLSLAADRAAVMLYLRGDLRAAPQAVAYEISEDSINAGTWSSARHIPGGLAWMARIGTAVKTTPPNAIFIPMASDKEAVLAKLAAGGVAVTTGRTPYQTNNGELMLDRASGVLTVDTPRTAGGYADQGRTIEALRGGVRIDKIVTGATVYATSIDSQPLRSSSRILVTHLTDLQNSGAHYGESARQTLLKWGDLPYLVRNGEATVHLTLDNPAAYTIWELSVAGHRIATVPSVVAGKTLSFTATVRGAYGARMLYEVTTETGQPDPIVATIKADMQVRE